MTDELKNGTQSVPPQMNQQEMADMMVTNWCWPVLASAVNGIRTALMPQGVPIGLIVVRISGLMGRVLGETLSVGDLGSILSIRSECVKAFTEALRGVKIQPPPMPQGDSVFPPRPN